MCPSQRIPESWRLPLVIEISHAHSDAHPNDPLDLYRLHDNFTTTDEPDDDVGDANENVGFEYGYGRPEMDDYEFQSEEVRIEMEERLSEFWPVERGFGGEEGDERVVCEDEDQGDGEDGRGEGEQDVGGDDDGERVRTNDTEITATAAAAEEEEVSTIRRYTNTDNPGAPTPANTPTQRFRRLAINNNATVRAVQRRND